MSNNHVHRTTQRLTLIFPVFREARRLHDSLAAVSEFITATKEVEVNAVFVDDGSPDNSRELIEQHLAEHPDLGIKLISYAKNRGKGFAVKTGVAAADGDLILMSDTDLSTPLTEWHKLYQAMQSADADIVCGSRAVSGADIRKKAPVYRRLLSKIFNLLVHLAGVRGISDTQCGFKLFQAEAAQTIFAHLRTERFAFDVEMIAKARDLGYEVIEVPVRWDYSDHSTVKVFSSGGRMVFDIFLLVLHRLRYGRFTLEAGV